MVFNSLQFVVFFALFFVLYWTLMRRNLKLQNVFLLGASLLFYGFWDWRFVSLLVLTICTTYFTAILTERGHRYLWTAINICINITILCIFKYFNFFSANLVQIGHLLGWEFDWFTIDVLLPVGISFYTFQAIGYSIDVYKRRTAVEHNFVNFAIFISYFPQLVAGPIERAQQLIPQIARVRSWNRATVTVGFRQALWGMFKKVVIADACAEYVDMAFGRPADEVTVVMATLAAIMFSIQIYCDFSGYCDIAKGASACLGITLTQNFRYPYFSQSVQDFWRRWNLSLMQWFREYVYIPLGGSRRGLGRTYVNIMIVFLLSGLWHGASWNFVIWGAFWGICLSINRAYSKSCSRNLPKHWGMIITCLLSVVGWIIFRCSTFNDGLQIISKAILPLCAISVTAIIGLYIYKMLAKTTKSINTILWIAAAVIFSLAITLRPIPVIRFYLIWFAALMFIFEWHRRDYDFPLMRLPRQAILRIGIYWVLIFMILTNYMEDIPFIYFQF